MEMKLPLTLDRFINAYNLHYDSNNWFLPGATVTKVIPYGERPYQFILSLEISIKTRDFLPSNTMDCCVISSIINTDSRHFYIIKKDIECKNYSKKKSIIELFSVFILLIYSH